MSTILSVQVANPCRPAPVGTTGTGLFPLLGDITAWTSFGASSTNPYAIENSTSATDDGVYVLDVPPGWNWLDAYQMLLNASGNSTQINITTALQGVFFGKFPIRTLEERFSADPRTMALSGASWAAGWAAALGRPTDASSGIWLPLDNPVSGTTLFTFPSGSPPSPTLFQNQTAASATYPNIGGLTDRTASAIRAHSVTARTSVFLGGASRVMFLPTTRAVLSAGTGILVGRFVA